MNLPSTGPIAADQEADRRRSAARPASSAAASGSSACLPRASALIAEKGSDAMRMSEVAEQAGVSIGSLYQYFPDKARDHPHAGRALQRAGRACIEEALADVRDIDGLREAFGRLIDIYYGLFLAEPVMRDIWSGMQADKALREVELAESRANGALLADAMLRRAARRRSGKARPLGLPDHVAGRSDDAAGDFGRARRGRRAGRGLQADGAAGDRAPIESPPENKKPRRSGVFATRF